MKGRPLPEVEQAVRECDHLQPLDAALGLLRESIDVLDVLLRHLIQSLDGLLLRLLLRSGDAVQRGLLRLTGDVMEAAADGLDLFQRVGDRLGGLSQFDGQVLLLPRYLLHRPGRRQQITIPAAFLRQLLSGFAGLLGFGI